MKRIILAAAVAMTSTSAFAEYAQQSALVTVYANFAAGPAPTLGTPVSIGICADASSEECDAAGHIYATGGEGYTGQGFVDKVNEDLFGATGAVDLWVDGLAQKVTNTNLSTEAGAINDFLTEFNQDIDITTDASLDNFDGTKYHKATYNNAVTALTAIDGTTTFNGIDYTITSTTFVNEDFNE